MPRLASRAAREDTVQRIEGVEEEVGMNLGFQRVELGLGDEAAHFSAAELFHMLDDGGGQEGEVAEVITEVAASALAAAEQEHLLAAVGVAERHGHFGFGSGDDGGLAKVREGVAAGDGGGAHVAGENFVSVVQISGFVRGGGAEMFQGVQTFVAAAARKQRAEQKAFDAWAEPGKGEQQERAANPKGAAGRQAGGGARQAGGQGNVGADADQTSSPGWWPCLLPWMASRTLP